MKFCAGWFDGEIWLNQTQEGTSFGVYEISAKNNNVPTKSRMRAKTSLQALCLSVRATASDSNSMPASFNLVVATLVRQERMAFDTAEPQGCERHRRAARQSERAGASESNALQLGRFHSCTQHQRLITVPAQYGFFLPPRRHFCFVRHAAVLRILRKASGWSDAGSSARAARSGNKSLVRRKQNRV